ncbi:MAG: trypsin-like peptidase domain-containing protein [Nitrospira sp.]|nr:trypsin-like peptidase domain-containing protein [Nitrospira sp.]
MNLIRQLSQEINSLVEGVVPSIVQIYGVPPTEDQSNPENKPKSFWNSLMRDDEESDEELVEDSDEESCSYGAGVVISTDGIIVTNHHVVENCEDLMVILPDGRRFEPKICGVDPISDLAVLQIPANNLRVPGFATDESVKVGEIVLAVGHPFGYESTVTMGIVSSPARLEFPPDEGFERPLTYIQTDAAINPGNSGGALIDCEGRVVGINTWGTDSSESQGLAFAIPIKTVMRITEILIKHGHVSYGTIGVTGVITDLPAKVSSDHGIKQSTALLVENVKRWGRAGQIGIKPGEFILSVDGTPIDTLEKYLEEIDKNVGKEVHIRLLRQNDSISEKTIKVKKLE